MYTRNAVRVIFFVSGVSLVFLSFALKLLDYALASEMVKDFAVIAVSIALLDIVWSALGGELGHKDAPDSQATKVFLNVREAEKEYSWLELIRSSKNRIDLQGLSLEYFSSNRDFLESLKERIVAGVKVRIVFMSSENPLLRNTSRLRSFLYPENIILWSRQSANVFESMRQEVKEIKSRKGELAVVVNESLPLSMSIRRFDQHLFVLPYIWNRNNHNSPIYYIKGESKPLFQKYIESFEEQFNELQKH